MQAVIGKAGVADDDLAALEPRFDEAATALERQRRTGWAALPYAKSDLKRTVRLAEQVRGAFEHLVVLGTRGSALATRALLAALTAPGRSAGTPAPDTLRVHVVDRLDPEAFAALLTRLDLRRTIFNVVSGSGDALETVSLFLVVRDRLLKELGAVAYKAHVVVTTHTDGGPLRQIVNDEGFHDLALPSDVDESATLLTAAALFPAACAGSDVGELLAGAADMDERCREAANNPARLLALGLLRAGVPHGGALAVRSPTRALGMLARWITRVVTRPTGPSSTVAPSSDLTIFLRPEERRVAIEVPRAYQDLEGVSYLGGAELGELADLQEQVVESARWSEGRPTLTVLCPGISPFVIGQIAQLIAIGTALAQAVTGPDDGSRGDATATGLAHGLAGRPGYEAARAEAQRWAAKREARYVL
jgi:glucose-6-phosphate isomerase